MKKALKLALIYLINLVAGTILGTIIYSFYQNLLGFVAGHDISFFTDTELLSSFFYVFFCMLCFIIPLVAYYRMRHPGGFLQLIVYVVLCLITWGLVVPCSIKLKEFCYNHFDFETEDITLSPNYFRHVNNNVYYFTREFEKPENQRYAIEQAPAVVFSTTEDGKTEYKILKNYDSLEVKRKALPFREIQLKNIFGDEKNPIPVDFRVLSENISKGYFEGFSGLLTLLSFILVLCSVYGITSLFDWRLLNAVMLFIVTAVILSFNSVYFLPQSEALKLRLTSNGFFKFLGRAADEPLLFLINCCFALILIATGIIKFAVRKHAAKAR